MILVMFLAPIFLFVIHCDLLLFAFFPPFSPVNNTDISRIWWSHMLVRDINLYLCHNVQVRLLQHILFFTFSANTVHPSPLTDPSLLSGIASQLLVLHMSLHYLATASDISMLCLQNIYSFLQRMYLAPADVMMWLITACFIPKSTTNCIPVAGVPFPTAVTGMLWGANTSCWTRWAVGHEVKVGRAQESHIHLKANTMLRAAGCNWSFWDKPLTTVSDWPLDFNFSFERGSSQQQGISWGGYVSTRLGRALL